MNLAVRAKAFKELTGHVQKGVLTFLVEGLTTQAIEAKWPEQFEEARLVWIATAEIGQKRTLSGPGPNVRLAPESGHSKVGQRMTANDPLQTN